MFISMIFEITSIGIILPLIKIITDSEFQNTNKYFKIFYNLLKKPKNEYILLYLLLLFILLYLIKTIVLTQITRSNYKFTFNLQSYFSQKLYDGYMNLPINVLLQKNSSELIQNSLHIVGMTTSILVHLIMIASEIITAFAILIFLFYIQPFGFLVLTLTFGTSYLIFNKITKEKILNYGKKYQEHEKKRLQYLQESFNSVKEIKILNREEFFSQKYFYENKNSADSQFYQQSIQFLPRFYLELFGIISISLMVVGLIFNDTKFENIIISLILFAGSAFRLIPSLNRITGALQFLRFASPVLDTLAIELDLIKSHEKKSIKFSENINFFNKISFQNICYTHQNANSQIFNNLTFDIPCKSMVAFIGPTGSGKSTIIDILTGLILPESGVVKIDDIDINSNLQSWQSMIGLVPQNVSLIDDTLIKNIAFGIPDNEINIEKVLEVLKLTNLESLVLNLPNGIYTNIGELGSRLSGGEKQRIGIARVLYFDKEIIILDESTSALDNETELKIIDIINKFKSKKTIIIIAHRLTTIKNCDYIYELNNGEISMKHNNA
jgi:ABC-type multidrug transport system fused ATPase/permease subunit